jgi:drug/metabolite transporter (DMT)-like permease
MDSLPCTDTQPTRKKSAGWLSGLIGVLIFSGSLPATRIAVLEMDAFFLTVIRATVAGALALVLLLALRQTRPAPRQLLSLLIVAVGVVAGFPLLTALALQHVTSAHSIVFLGLLPLTTAVLPCCAVASGLAAVSGGFRCWALRLW